jgi:hypothetical protein
MYANTHAGVPLSPDEFDAEVEKIDTAVAAFSTEMKEHLINKLRQGWRGWDDPANAQEIYNAMLAHGAAIPLAIGQEAAIANFAMFLWYHRNGRKPQVRS